MDEARRDEINRLKRRAEKLRIMGRPQRILPAEFEVAKDILVRARDFGMSSRQIGCQVGVHQTTVSRILRGEQEGLTREKFERIKGLVFEPPGADELRTGAHVDCEGTMRRMQALQADGFTFIFIGSYMGLSKQAITKLAAWRPYVYMSTALRVAEMYDKLVGTDPLDYGISPHQVRRAKEAAVRRGFAPSDCWDEETIDDPAAFPDFTGMCGTLEGMITHLIRDIPVCKPCKDAQPSCRGVKVTAGLLVKRFYRFNSANLTGAMKERGVSAARLEKDLPLATGVVVKWLRGSQRPSLATSLRVAEYLDLLWFDLYERNTDS